LTGDTPVHTLYRANFDTLELTELQRFETGFDYSLEGQWDKGPVVLEAVSLPPSNDPAYSEAFENRDYHLYTLGLNSGRRETLMRWKQGLPYAMQGNTFFYWDDDADQLHALFANTGEDSVAAHGFAPDDHSFVSMQRAFYGGQIILQFSNTSGSRVTSVAVNPATGATFTPPLPSRSQNITIIAELAPWAGASLPPPWAAPSWCAAASTGSPAALWSPTTTPPPPAATIIPSSSPCPNTPSSRRKTTGRATCSWPLSRTWFISKDNILVMCRDISTALLIPI